MLNAIVGIDIHITEIQCKYKLSQNRSAEDQKKVASYLDKQGEQKLVESMIRYVKSK